MPDTDAPRENIPMDSKDDGPRADGDVLPEKAGEVALTGGQEDTKLAQETSAAPPAGPAPELSEARKNLIVLVLALYAFCSTATIGVLYPALPLVQKDLNTSQQAVNSSVSVSSFVSGLAPLFWAAVSDVRGRRFVYLCTGPILIASSIAGYWTPNIAVFYIIRIIQQAAGSAVVSTASGSIADIFPREKLAGHLSYMYLGMSAGPTFSPLFGGLIVQASSWRWTFVFAGMLAAVVWTGVALIVPETLKKKPVEPGVKQDNVIVKAFKSLLFNRYPFVFAIVMVISMCFAVLFSLSVTIPYEFTELYNFTVSQVGYVQLASGIGMFGATFVMGQYSNYVFLKWKNIRGGVAVPEDRLRATWPAIATIVAGCLILGWTLVARTHWSVPALGSVIAGWGTMAFSASTNAYLIDLFLAQASSIIASANFLRFTLASVGPLIVYPFQIAAGSGWLYTFWALLNVAAFCGLLWVVYRGTVYRLALEPWKSGPSAHAQLKAVGAIKDVEMAAKDDDESVVV